MKSGKSMANLYKAFAIVARAIHFISPFGQRGMIGRFVVGQIILFSNESSEFLPQETRAGVLVYPRLIWVVEQH